MTKRILFFESDAGFAADVADRLRRHGAEVEVTDDGNAGVDAAAQNRPDLILLTIELPQVNGFLVCKKLKKSPETASIPIIILSSEATEEIFEQHRKLRTRAEDYLRKPIGLDALMERVQAIVPLEPIASDADDVIAISDEVDVSFDNAPPFESAQPFEDRGPGTDLHKAKPVDPDIDAFADSAFDALVVGDEEHTTVGQIPADLLQSVRAAQTPKAEPVAAARPAAPPPLAAPPPPSRPLTGPPPPMASAASTANADLERKVRDAEAAVVRAENRARAAEEQTAGLDKLRTEVSRLEKELGDAKRAVSIAPGAKTGGVSSREFLDLRESLNKKDKENLDLRDQLSARDKQMFELRDKNLGFERSIADASDKQLELERAIADLNDQVEALTADKDSASKRAEDFKGRAERSETRVKKLEGDLESEKAVRSADAARLSEELRNTVDALKAQHGTALESTRTDLTGQLETARTEHASAVETMASEHAAALESAKAEHASALEALRSEHESALAKLRAEHSAAMESTTSNHESATEALINSHTTSLSSREAQHAADKASAIEALTAELTTAKDTAVSSLRTELETAHASALEEATKKHATAIEESVRKHNTELAAIGRKLAEAENTNAVSAEQISERETEVATLTKTLEETRAESTKTLEETRTAATKAFEDAKAAATKASEDAKAAATKAEAEASARIASLEADLGKARGKISGDGEILDRARRALEISLALLEDQKTNGAAS